MIKFEVRSPKFEVSFKLVNLLLTSHFLLLTCTVAASAQIGDPIVEVRLEQEGQVVTDRALIDLVETVVGEPLSMRDVRETTAHFMSMSRFEDVQSFADSVAGGIRVRYELMPLHPVDRVEFSGAVAVSEDYLRRVIRDRYGAAPGNARAGDVAGAVRQAYRSRGYPNATVVPRIVETHNPDRATMFLDVNAGRRALIAEVMMFQTDEREALTALGAPVIRTGRPYDEEEVERALQVWTNRMRDRGYYEARASHGVSFPDDAYLTVNIVRGRHVVIAFSGDPLPEDERERLVPVRAEGSADEDLLEDAARNIEEYFYVRGHRDANVEYTPVEKNDELVITFDINRGPRYTIDEVAVRGNTALSLLEVRELLRIKERDRFVAAELNAGLAAVRNAYRARGHTQASVMASDAVLAPEDPRAAEREIDVTIAIVEGPRMLVRSVAFQGSIALSEVQLSALVAMAPGRPYSDIETVTARDLIDLEYRNRGYEAVVVKPDVTRAENDTQADIAFQITEGPLAVVDHIIILGNQRTSNDTIERELLLREGDPLGYASLLDSRSRLMALGLFSGVQIEPATQSGQGGRRDILVRVQEAPPNSIGVGGGLEGASRLKVGEGGQAEETFELAPRGFFQIGRRNLWGKNRSVNLFTRVSLRSRHIVVSESGVGLVEAADQQGLGFNEYRVIGTFREPRVFDSPAELLVTGIVEQAIRSSFNFTRRIVRAEAGRPLPRGYSVAGRYSFEKTKLFDEKFPFEDKPLIDRIFPDVRLSKVTGSLIRDRRDDLADTSRGTLFVIDGDLASRAMGSEVGFVRTYVQGFTFHRLPTSRRIVAAFGARIGAAHGLPREVPRVDGNGAVLGEDGAPIVDIVQDLPASERFFAGGDTSVRGFSLDRLGNQETISPAGFPKGGNSVIVLNAELRVTVVGPLQAVGFLDAGNVFPRASDLDFGDLRPAAGVGVRYRSPVGPVRFDLGFNLDPRELVPGTPERRTVFHISLGQAF